MAHRGIANRLDLIELQLERIADALEEVLPLLEKIANPPLTINIPPADLQPTKAWPNGGYKCAICGTWVMSGVVHTCSGRAPWGGSGTGGMSPNQCSAGGSSSTRPELKHVTTWNFPLAGTAVGETIT